MLRRVRFSWRTRSAESRNGGSAHSGVISCENQVSKLERMDTRRTIAGGCIPDARRGKRTRSTLLVLIKTRPCSYRLTTLLNQVDGSLHSELATFVGGGRRANRSIPPYQPESEIGGRFSDRTSAQAYVADEIGHVCAMASFHNPNAAICARDCLLA